jgi:CRP-like cAMP-binding protein
LSFYIPGDIPDLQSMFLKRMDHDLATISEAKLGFIKHSDIERLIGTYPVVARALWRETLIDASIFREWIVNMGARPAPARMAHVLAEVRERMAAIGLAEDNGFEFPVTQTKLAEALGLSPVHINRVIQEFRADHVLDIKKNRVTIKDLSRLLAIAEFNDSYLHLVRNVSP